MIKAVIFDCFGVVLADTLRAKIASIQQVDPQKGIQITDVLKAADRGLISRQETTEQLAGFFGITTEEVMRQSDEGEVRNEELIDFIKSLKGHYKLAMLSNIRSRERLDVRFKRGQLDDLFEVIVASGDVGLIKPERQIYELVAEKLGVDPSECIMIDDNPTYCEGAEAAGMTAIQFISNEQCRHDLAALIDIPT